MEKLYLSSSPHIRLPRTTRGIMLDVIIALLPAAIAGCVIFGWRSIAVLLVTVASCVLSEYAFNKIIKKENTVKDLSAVVTGLLLGMNLSADIPLWQPVIGGVFAIVVVKCIFGGIGCNIVNPAIASRVFMMLAFSTMTRAAGSVLPDAIAGATPLVHIAQGNTPDLMALFMGNSGGMIGETCALALLIGGIYLMIRRVITPHIPLVFIGTVFVFTLALENFCFTDAFAGILSGGLFLGAFFMATDYVTSPATAWGKIIFAAGAGIVTVLIRYFGNYPEGVSFAILFMNILNPYIENATQRKMYGGFKA